MKSLFRIALFTLVAAAVTLPATAQVIPAGDDRWVTPADGGTSFTFPPGDVESLCGAMTMYNWDRTVALRGVSAGADWDTIVTRLKDAELCNRKAVVPIRVRFLHFENYENDGFHETPCGEIHWDVRHLRNQPTTEMVIEQDHGQGGNFRADLHIRVGFTATTVDGESLGTLIYTLALPDPADGTPWQFGGPTGWQPGINQDETCFDVLREKAGELGGNHVYFIEDLIAQGRCQKRPNA